MCGHVKCKSGDTPQKYHLIYTFECARSRTRLSKISGTIGDCKGDYIRIPANCRSAGLGPRMCGGEKLNGVNKYTKEDKVYLPWNTRCKMQDGETPAAPGRRCNEPDWAQTCHTYGFNYIHRKKKPDKICSTATIGWNHQTQFVPVTPSPASNLESRISVHPAHNNVFRIQVRKQTDM